MGMQLQKSFENSPHHFTGIFFLATTYVAADTAFGFTNIFKSTPARDLKSVGLFILLVIWPVVAVLLYFVTMSVIVLRVLEEKKPLCKTLLYWHRHLLILVNSVLHGCARDFYWLSAVVPFVECSHMSGNSMF
jgi:Chitin synthase export chaperone